MLVLPATVMHTPISHGGKTMATTGFDFQFGIGKFEPSQRKEHADKHS